jgi:NADH-quinone oxidoreductase subunit J
MTDSFLLFSAVAGLITTGMAVIALLKRNLILSIASYAISSVSLASLFFILGSPFAGALELTVGAGLVSVLFLVALILAGGEEEGMPA